MTKQLHQGWRDHVLNTLLPKMEASATSLTPGPANEMPVNVGFQALQPGIDVLDLLPPGAAEKLRLLRLRSDDLHAIIPAGEDVRQAGIAKIEAGNALRRLTDHPQDGGFNLPVTDRRVMEATKVLDKATDDFDRLKQLQEVRAAAWQMASQAKAACEDWLRYGVPANCQIAEIEIEPPKLLKGEAVLDAVERLRRRGRELKANLHRIRSAPFPSSYAKQRMREQIEAVAMQGAPSVSALIELDGGQIEFQARRLTSEVHAERRSLAFAQVPDALALIAWLHKDELIAALDREISTEADDKAALSHEARQKAEAEVMSDLLSTERDICSLILRGQADGLPVEFPADINPLAILQVQLITAPRPTNGHASSPEHAYGRP